MLIVFEGIDGCGKTTLSKRYVEYLQGKGIDAIWTCEPTHEGRYGAEIRRMLRGEEPMLGPVQLAPLFAIDRLDHVKRVIGPALDRDAVVVCDRYVHSNVAYQSAGIVDSQEQAEFAGWVLEMNRQAPIADVFVYLEVRPEVARERVARRGVLEHYDGPEMDAFRARVVENYRRIPFDVVLDTSDLTEDESLQWMKIALASRGAP